MRTLFGVAALTVGVLLAGCRGGKEFDGPTVDKFTGRLTRGSEPVSFPAGETVILWVTHEKGESFGIPIQADGTFQIGWMPIGKYAAVLKREKSGAGQGGASPYTVPGGLLIEESKTEYTIDLGKGWRL